jgi:hypothetical protein
MMQAVVAFKSMDSLKRGCYNLSKGGGEEKEDIHVLFTGNKKKRFIFYMFN